MRKVGRLCQGPRLLRFGFSNGPSGCRPSICLDLPQTVQRARAEPWPCIHPRPRSFDQVVHRGGASWSGSQSAQRFPCGAAVGLASAAVFVAGLMVAVPSIGLLRRPRYATRRARATAFLALAGYLAVVVWGSVTGWPLAVMILSVAYLWEAGVMLTWPTLRSRADLDQVAVGAAFLLVGSAFLLLGISNPLDAWTLSMVAGLLVKVAFLLFGVAALALGVGVLLDKWTLVGGPFVLFGVAALLAGVAAFLDGWTLVGVALLLGPSRPCCSGSHSCSTDQHWWVSRSWCARSRPR